MFTVRTVSGKMLKRIGDCAGGKSVFTYDPAEQLQLPSRELAEGCITFIENEDISQRALGWTVHTEIPTQTLIDNIDWNKPFDDLSDNEKCNFLSLHKFGMLPRKGGEFPEYREIIESRYRYCQEIVDERGTDKLYLYI
jgi:hypothetical protein